MLIPFYGFPAVFDRCTALHCSQAARPWIIIGGICQPKGIIWMLGQRPQSSASVKLNVVHMFILLIPVSSQSSVEIIDTRNIYFQHQQKIGWNFPQRRL